MDPTTLNSARDWRPVIVAAVAAMGVCLSMVVAVHIMDGGVAFPQCGFRELTGIPCPGCGTTRSLALMAEGKLSAAVKTNPLVSLTVLTAFLAVPFLWLGVRSNPMKFFRRTVGGKVFRWAAAGLIAANWAYLIYVG